MLPDDDNDDGWGFECKKSFTLDPVRDKFADGKSTVVNGIGEIPATEDTFGGEGEVDFEDE